MDEENTSKSFDPEFVKILSHQLKSPIHAIQALLGTVADGYAGEVDKKVLHFIEKAINRSKEAQEVVSDLLDYEFFAENTPDNLEEYDLIEVLDELSRKYNPVAAEKNISLTFDIPDNSMLLVMGNVTGINHALKNLIENAIKYTNPPGRVHVRLSIKTVEKLCTLEISDTGAGIPEEEHDKIFKPFYRAVKTKSVTSGTGLGLAIAKKVIDNHKGTIEISSKVNEGTTFTIILPYQGYEEQAGEAEERVKVVIIGGVTAGPKVAARLRRLDENLDITIIEQHRFLSYSGCGLPSFISGEVPSPTDLMSTGDGTARDINFFESIQNIPILNRTLAEIINRENRTVTVKNLDTGKKSDIPYDYLVLATGGQPVVPEIPGIDLPGIYTLRSLEDAVRIKEELKTTKAKDVFILGGGLIGASAAESLIESGARITILEKKPFILLSQLDSDMAHIIQSGISKKGIKVLTGVTIENIKKSDSHLVIHSSDGNFAADFIILSTGVKPSTSLGEKAGLAIGPSGGIKVDSCLKTSDESIYAIGDCAESINLITGKHEYWPLGSISTKMGRIAADNICNRHEEFTGSIGTAFLKIFDINVARTGLTSASALKHGFDPVSLVISGEDKAHYVKGVEYISLKVIADRTTRRILGAQGCGMGDVVKRIETLACAISLSMTLTDFFKIDLGYAPAYNRPIDISQTACLALNNKLDGLLRTVSAIDFDKDRDSYSLLDLSPPEEHAAGSIPGSLNIPLERIRHERIPFDKGAKILLYSKTSAGAFIAFRYLSSKGYLNLHVLEGGYILWNKSR